MNNKMICSTDCEEVYTFTLKYQDSLYKLEIKKSQTLEFLYLKIIIQLKLYDSDDFYKKFKLFYKADNLLIEYKEWITLSDLFCNEKNIFLNLKLRDSQKEEKLNKLKSMIENIQTAFTNEITNINQFFFTLKDFNIESKLEKIIELYTTLLNNLKIQNEKLNNKALIFNDSSKKLFTDEKINELLKLIEDNKIHETYINFKFHLSEINEKIKEVTVLLDGIKLKNAFKPLSQSGINNLQETKDFYLENNNKEIIFLNMRNQKLKWIILIQDINFSPFII